MSHFSPSTLLKAIDLEDQSLFVDVWNYLWTRGFPSEVFNVVQGNSESQNIFISQDLFKPEFIPAEVAYSIAIGTNRFQSSDTFYLECPLFKLTCLDANGKSSCVYESDLKALNLALGGYVPLSKGLPVLNFSAFHQLLPRPFRRILHKYNISLVEFLLRFPDYLLSTLGEPIRLLLQVKQWTTKGESEDLTDHNVGNAITVLISDSRFIETQDLQGENFLAYLYSRILASDRVLLVDKSLNIVQLLYGSNEKLETPRRKFTLRDLAYQDLCKKIKTKYVLVSPNTSPKAGAIDQGMVYKFRQQNDDRAQKDLCEIDGGIVGLPRECLLNVQMPWKKVLGKIDAFLKYASYSSGRINENRQYQEVWLICVSSKVVDSQRCREAVESFLANKVCLDTVIAVLQLSTMEVCYLEETLRRESFSNELRRWKEQKKLIILFGECDRADFKSITGICKHRSSYGSPIWLSFSESVTTTAAPYETGIFQARSQLSPYRAVTRGYIGGLQCYDARLLFDLEYKGSYKCLHNLNTSISLQLLGNGQTPHVVHYPLIERDIALHPTVLETGPIGMRRESLLNILSSHENSEIYDKYSAPLLSPYGSLTPSRNCYINEVVYNNVKASVTIVIPFKDKSSLTDKCVHSVIAHAGNVPFEIILVNNRSTEEKTYTWIAHLTSQSKALIRVMDFDGEFNFAAINNEAARLASGDYFLLLNNDIEITQDNFLQLMLNPFGLKNVGCVGGTLLYPDGSLQHHGVAIPWGIQAHDTLSPGKHQNIETLQLNQTCFQSGDVYSAVTAACMLVPRDLYIEMNGMNENFIVAYNDVDFCLRLGAIGLDCVNISTPIGIHYESKSRGLDLKGDNYNRLYREGGLLRAQHRLKYDYGDLYYSPVLDQASSLPRLARHPATSLGETSQSVKLLIENHDVSSLEEVLIYASFSHNGEVPAFVTRQIQIFAQHVPIIFVLAVESFAIPQCRLNQISKHCHVLIVRDNIGYDFGSWSSAVRLYGKRLKSAKRVYLANDSCYGPFRGLSSMFSMIRECSADLVGLTDNTVFQHHLQSFFVEWNWKMIRSGLFYHFWHSICEWKDKSDIIKAYEVGLGAIVREAGATSKAIYTDMPHENATHTRWKELLEQGFPFVKRELISTNPTGQDISGIYDTLSMLDPLSASAMLKHLKFKT